MSLSGYESSYYVDSANSKKDYLPLVGEICADVCVIGAGFTGLSAALHLAEQGYKVTVLEAERIGWGASGRNGGQVCPGHNMSHIDIASKVGKHQADLMWNMSVESVDLVKSLINKHQIRCDMKKGILYTSNTASYAKDMERAVEYTNTVLEYEPFSYLDKSQVSKMLGTDKYYGAKYWKEAVHLHPLNYALGLAEAAEKAGVTFYENSRVLDYKPGEDAFVKTETGHVKAKYVLLACNGYLGKLAPKVAGKIMPINNFMIATEPLPRDLCRRLNKQDVAVADSTFVVNYYKLSGDNRLLWGGGENYSRHFPKDIEKLVSKNMLKFYPELADVKIDYAWGGTLAITLNRMPHFARLDQNTFVAQGYSGHGVALATLGGKLMADAICGSAEKFDVFANFPTPTFPGGTLLRWPGLMVGMFYYSMRDRLGI